MIDMVTVMSKFLVMGVPMAEVVRQIDHESGDAGQASRVGSNCSRG